MLELLRDLLELEADEVKESILNLYIDKAEKAIKNYSWLDEIPEELNNSVVELASYFYKNKDSLGIVQQTQGSRNQTNVDGIPKSILCNLPLPRVRMM
ncbi:gp6-like head-tail connector protein [Natranaerovirga pectinivora]|uniref:Gp6-like head-tail connector protein n=1 Tax=Natranaerovirga pectinivora TaxID=682400 RepID=A0A4R3MP96_9FIRM|nr:phage head-tail connector protein [Natranaerovirga pectinivora]TCT16400.1 gp6-like head-tail connector protein [Natranaerovirga pectinivora]